MELNLRKARKLEKSIEALLKTTSIGSEATIRVQQDIAVATAQLETAQKNTEDSAEFRQKLIKLRYDVRAKIASANHGTGINGLIHEKALVEALLVENKAVAETTVPAYTLADLLEMKKKKLIEGNSGYHRDSEMLTASVSSISAAARNKAILEVHRLKSEVERIDDELSQKNIGVKITLDADAVNLLKRAQLI